MSVIPAFGILATNYELMIGSAKVLWEGIVLAGDQLGEVFKSTFEIFMNAVNAVKGVLDATVTLITSLLSSVGDLFGEVFDVVKALGSVIWDLITFDFDSLGESFSELAQEVGEMFKAVAKDTLL